jgi:hypothetical protein
MLERLTSDYPWFAEFIDVQTVKKIDASVSAVYVAITEQAKAEKEQAKARRAKLQEQIELVDALLNTL